MMYVISSQRFRSDEIVEEKKEMLETSGTTSITVPVIRSFMKDLDGNELYILVDNHHTLTAARELDLSVDYVIVEDEISYYQDIEEQNGEAICESHYMDSSWYYINHGDEDMIGVDVW